MILANSWGAATANNLANQYQQRCGTLTELFILVDGVVKPVTFSYTSKLVAKKCVSIYETVDIVHGAPIQGCQNIDLTPQVRDHRGLGGAHIATEWSGTRMGANLIAALLDQHGRAILPE